MNDEIDSPGFEVNVDLDPEVSAKVEPATAETHDRRKVQDRSGLLMNAQSEINRKIDHRIIQDGDRLACSRCQHETFRVFCSSVDNHLQIICGNRGCGAMFPIMEVYPVQMNDRIAKATGLYVPPGRN